jgi:hypothetical protein
VSASHFLKGADGLCQIAASEKRFDRRGVVCSAESVQHVHGRSQAPLEFRLEPCGRLLRQAQVETCGFGDEIQCGRTFDLKIDTHLGGVSQRTGEVGVEGAGIGRGEPPVDRDGLPVRRQRLLMPADH